jgi:hypothetical protein
MQSTPFLESIFVLLKLIFRVIDGLEVLDDLEKVPVDAKSRPLSEVKIQSITIHANPVANEQY